MKLNQHLGLGVAYGRAGEGPGSGFLGDALFRLHRECNPPLIGGADLAEV